MVKIFAKSLVSLRSHMGIVLQDPYLFTGTIASNVAMSQEHIDRDAEASDLKVKETSRCDVLQLSCQPGEQMVAFYQTVCGSESKKITQEHGLSEVLNNGLSLSTV